MHYAELEFDTDFAVTHRPESVILVNESRATTQSGPLRFGLLESGTDFAAARRPEYVGSRARYAIYEAEWYAQFQDSDA